MAIKSPVKVRVFSDRPVDMNIIWMAIVGILIILSVVLGYKYTEKCPDVVCPVCTQKDCPSCNLDCSTCPIMYRNITKEREILKYVCVDTLEQVAHPDDCVAKIRQSTINAITTNEEGTFIEQSKVEPRCINGLNGGWIYYSMEVTPDDVVVEVQEIGNKYTDKKTYPGLLTANIYFTICSGSEVTCKASGDFYLDRYKIYKLRLRFNESKTTGRIEYSNEYVIDTTSTSEYLEKNCK